MICDSISGVKDEVVRAKSMVWSWLVVKDLGVFIMFNLFLLKMEFSFLALVLFLLGEVQEKHHEVWCVLKTPNRMVGMFLGQLIWGLNSLTLRDGLKY